MKSRLVSGKAKCQRVPFCVVPSNEREKCSRGDLSKEECDNGEPERAARGR